MHTQRRKRRADDQLGPGALTVAVRGAAGVVAGRSAARGHPRCVERRRDPPQRCTAVGRLGSRGRVVGGPA
ncbi:putative conserved membrane protein [Mycobacterium xenopi 4042]|uniref:Putative conserved membrane protein n=1 Tax=Mycobacterium xenopi 4042 TaxID=1299334 RepID=X8CKM5_MYCXE|nr:putative conserved membrane protein [Mycobacterium xenopi 4042]